MGLFQKKPSTTNSAPLYTLGLDKTFLVVGLGNMGNQYQNTRHNIGFNCINELINRLEFPNIKEKKDLKCLMTSNNIAGNKVVVIKPTTFMNLSGEAVQLVANFYKIPVEQIIVIYDELDIDFGQIRTRMGGGDAGHNGVKSVIQYCGENFARVRFGIKNSILEKADSADFVLSKFTVDENKNIKLGINEVTSIITEYLYSSGAIEHQTRKFL